MVGNHPHQGFAYGGDSPHQTTGSPPNLVGSIHPWRGSQKKSLIGAKLFSQKNFLDLLPLPTVDEKFLDFFRKSPKNH